MQILPLGDLVWSAAFHTWGVLGFAIMAAVLVVETPLLKGLLRTPWDDTIGAVFLGHVMAFLLAWAIGIWFTEPLRALGATGTHSWSELAGWPGQFFGALLRGTPELVAWSSSSTAALLAAIGFSCVTFFATARAILHVPWTLRNVTAILGVSLLSSIALGATIYWTTRQVTATEAAPEVTPTGT